MKEWQNRVSYSTLDMKTQALVAFLLAAVFATVAHADEDSCGQQRLDCLESPNGYTVDYCNQQARECTNG